MMYAFMGKCLMTVARLSYAAVAAVLAPNKFVDAASLGDEALGIRQSCIRHRTDELAARRTFLVFGFQLGLKLEDAVHDVVKFRSDLVRLLCCDVVEFFRDQCLREEFG